MQIEQIDWHDFVVVEKIELYDDEEMKMIEEEEQERLEKEREAERVQEQIRKQIEENQQILQGPQMPPPPTKGGE